MGSQDYGATLWLVPGGNYVTSESVMIVTKVGYKLQHMQLHGGKQSNSLSLSLQCYWTISSLSSYGISARGVVSKIWDYLKNVQNRLEPPLYN